MVSLHGKSGKMKRKPAKVLKKKQKKVKKVKTLSLVDKTDDEVLRKNTKANAKKILLDADKPKKKRPRTVSSGSSVCQEESIGEKKKRVSFAKQLESTNDEEEISKDICSDEVISIKKKVTTNASPGKSILARKVKATKKAKSKLTSSPSSGKEDKENSMDTTSPPDQEKVVQHSTTKSSPEADQTMNESKSTNGMEMEVSPKAKKKHSDEKKMKILSGGGVEKVKKHTKIQVTRKVKEKLMTMNRKERRAFIKELQRKRKPNFDLALKCKQLWEKIRSAKCQEADREKYVHELYGLVKGKAKELIYAHDTCRVIECLTSLPKGTIRSLLFDELCPEIVRMSKSKYARFFVTKMLKNGSAAQRNIIINAFRGHCVSLMRIQWAAEVLETAYNDYANAEQRSNIVSEFYGKEYLLFKDESLKVVTLKDILEKDPAKKAVIIKNLEELLKDIVPKRQLKLSLTHRLLNEFFAYCNEEQKTEMIDSLKERIPEIIHTNDGTRIALQCIWGGTAKERKMIVKNFKSLVVKTCLEEFGHRVLIGIFDAVDDTVLVNKYIVSEIANEVGTVALNKFGERVLHYLINPRDPRYFGKGSIDIFKEGDNNAHSKKDAKERYAQLFGAIAKPLMTYISANLNELLFDTLTALLVLNILEPSGETDLFTRTIDDEDRRECYEGIAKLCGEEFIPCDTERLHAIEHPNAHFVISKLLQADSKFDVKLSDHLMGLGEATLSSWVSCNRGCFILLHMLENGSEEAKSMLQKCIPLATLKNYSTKGAQALLKKLSPK